jgi:hypothetical protein
VAVWQRRQAVIRKGERGAPRNGERKTSSRQAVVPIVIPGRCSILPVSITEARRRYVSKSPDGRDNERRKLCPQV